MSEQGLRHAVEKMRHAGANETAIEVFSHYYEQAASGETGLIGEDTIQPLEEPPALQDAAVPEEVARDAVQHLVMIKLNGGLGTSMGLDRAKTLLTVRNGKTFLDLIVDQVRSARDAHDARLPLVLMDSFRTQEDALGYLERFDDLPVDDLPLDFLQNAIPKIRVDDLEPVEWPDDPTLEWCPPGHGDLYTALLGSGLLEKLLDRGYKYASVANGDNLGAAPNATLAGWFAQSGAPFVTEVCTRTVNDRKGGHLAVRKEDGQLILRETAQTAKEEMDFFVDEHRHAYFNTNNLWLNLEQLFKALDERGPVLGLPLIRNEKNVDPTKSDSPKVLQLETAMGAAVEVFSGAKAILVGRDRFMPVKTTNELLLVRSDAFELTDDATLRATVEPQPGISLDERFYKLVGDFDERIQVVPSLKGARSLSVEGDWTFDAPVEVLGDAKLEDFGEAKRVPEGHLGDAQ